ncbi:MAG: hypothetical protein H0X69_14070 [Gemmatimonadales bacterium]|nr:hypothetical protein [Gemmatimonadales bacterium]
MFALVDAILEAYYAGQFGGGPTVEDQVLALISSLYCFVRLESPTLPDGSLGEDGVIGVVTPTSPTTTLAVPSEHAAVTIPAGAAPVPTMIVIRILPDEPGPLNTSLDQYPYFYEFSAFPEVTFTADVIAGICPRDNLDAIDANLRLAHNTGPDFGDIEVLPRPLGAVAGLDCTDLGGEEIGFRGSSTRPGDDAGEGWSSMRRVLAPLALALLPEPLHAATSLATIGVGGTTKKFSPFGIVDVTSNPGRLTRVEPAFTSEEITTETGATVTRTVVARSRNLTPIAGVPVVFTAGAGTLDGGSPQTILTDGNGQASVSWTLPSEPAVYTLEASVPEIDTPPLESTDPPGNIAFVPDAVFDTTSMTFTVAGADNGVLTALSCELEGEIRSSTGAPVTMFFDNRTDDEVSVFWLDHFGQRNYPFEGGGIGVPYAIMGPNGSEGDTHSQETFVTHPWILTTVFEGEGEFCHGIYLPLSDGETGGTVIVGDGEDEGPVFE